MRAVTLLCVFRVKFLRLSSDASQVRKNGGGFIETALPMVATSAILLRGKSIAPPIAGQNMANYSKTAALESSATVCLEDYWIILRAPPIYTGTPYSYIVSLGRSTLSFQITHVLLESNRTLPNKPGSVFNS